MRKLGPRARQALWVGALVSKLDRGRRKAMSKRAELLGYLWQQIINLKLREASLDYIIANCKRNPDRAFGDTGPAIERILAAGASRRDLCLVMRTTAYEAVFGTLYSLEEDEGCARIRRGEKNGGSPETYASSSGAGAIGSTHALGTAAAPSRTVREQARCSIPWLPAAARRPLLVTVREALQFLCIDEPHVIAAGELDQPEHLELGKRAADGFDG